MDYKAAGFLHGETENDSKTEVTKSVGSQCDAKDAPKRDPCPSEDVSQAQIVDPGTKDTVTRDKCSYHDDTSGEINMEAAISSDDVIRAGGFGARDDLNCFLPGASDSTDFESSLLDAREYEEPHGELQRPGLGWTEAKGAE